MPRSAHNTTALANKGASAAPALDAAQDCPVAEIGRQLARLSANDDALFAGSQAAEGDARGRWDAALTENVTARDRLHDAASWRQPRSIAGAMVQIGIAASEFADLLGTEACGAAGDHYSQEAEARAVRCLAAAYDFLAQHGGVDPAEIDGDSYMSPEGYVAAARGESTLGLTLESPEPEAPPEASA